jgi:hypothetical protein
VHLRNRDVDEQVFVTPRHLAPAYRVVLFQFKVTPDGLVSVAGRCRDEGDAGDMRHTAVQQHGASSRNTGSAPPPAPAAEVRYPFGVQNDLGQVILSGGAKVSPSSEEQT